MQQEDFGEAGMQFGSWEADAPLWTQEEVVTR